MADDPDFEQHERAFENRPEPVQRAIDAVAQHEPGELEEYGKKSEVAREHGVEDYRLHYVLNNWMDLIEYRRAAMRNPVDSAAVRAAYDDPALAEMAAADAETVADGAGNVTVDIELPLDKVFRAVKLLPGDLGLDIYIQTLEADLPQTELRRILDAARE